MNQRKVLCYGMGSLGKDLLGGMVSTYILMFYTDIFGISAVAAGSILMLTRIWDAINDPIMGSIVDRTRSRFGRFRPYILFVPLIMGICYTLVFTTPSFSSISMKIIYATITYTLAGMAFTAYDVPLWGMVPSLTSDPNDRNKLITSQRTFTMVAYLIVSILALPLVAKLGGGAGIDSQRIGFSRLALIFSVIGVVFAWITFFNTKETIDLGENKSSLKQLVQALVQNRPVLILLVSWLFIYMPTSIASAVNIYYISYYVGRQELFPIYMLLYIGMSVVGMLITISVAKRIGRMKTTVFSVLLAIVVNILLFFTGKYIFPLFIFSALYGLVGAAPGITVASMISDTSDYSYWKTGVRTDGMIFSLNSFTIKLGMALAIGLSGFVLSAIGYKANSLTQTGSVLVGINTLRFIIPCVCFIIGLLVLKKYPLTDKRMEEIRNDLNEGKFAEEVSK